MTLYTFEKPKTPWYPKDIDDFWWLFRSTREYNELLNIKGSIIEKRYKKAIKESKFPENCSPYSENDTAYKLFFIGLKKDFTSSNGGANLYELSNLDHDYCDGGEDEEGGCVWIEQNKRWFTPRKAQFFF